MSHKIVPIAERCQGQAYDPAGFGTHYRCPWKGTITEEGKLWCGRHAPSKVAERERKANERYEAKDLARRKYWARQAEDNRKLAAFDELLEMAERVLALKWVRETSSGEVVLLQVAVTKAKGEK